jgi:uncharacterized membrane protein
MPTVLLPWLDGLLCTAFLVLALLFQPWQVLRHPPLQSPWLGALVLLPCMWWMQHFLPSGMPLRMSGACMLVLMLGWPLAIWTLLPVAWLSAAWASRGWPDAGATLHQLVWSAMVPGTFGLLVGLLMRRILPQHLFVYILGRAFFGTVLAITLTGLLAGFVTPRPGSLAFEEWMLGYWLLGWGEAISTGMLTSIFVAFKPHWLLTYSDARYLPQDRPS